MAERVAQRRGYGKGIVGEMLAEFLGTFVLLLLGIGSVAVAVVGLPGSGRQFVEFGPANWLIISWGWGLAVVFGVYVAGGISGAHINPAVTLAFAVRRDFPWRKVLPYWLAQVLGAFVAAALIYACYHWAIDASNTKAGLPRDKSLGTYSIFATFPAEYFGDSWWGPLLDQIVGTGILLLLICALIDTRNTAPMANLHPFIIGLVVVAIGLTFGTNAGYAINPARDFGPRLFTFFEGWGSIALPGTFGWFSDYWWIPIVGPLIGGVLGVFAYDLIISPVLKARMGDAEEGPATEEPS
ncbi:MIP family channel protein [Streptomyces fungicidicus]|uniref:MIP family channel protein n=3 Tax=Streptomyces TaxID=1883 RepID=A0A494USR3_9ACTN|nr:MIP family channel protein [Streptomyces fungicidicus]EFL41929.1 transport integral membrane protein [Streptomyces griseoflavus Tu4000]QKV99906.1 MIP family channel protein [Streptomyces sp. NA02536]TQL23113.1 glycerol uptake facilitator protein [Streptomyces sp. SLBN-134]